MQFELANNSLAWSWRVAGLSNAVYVLYFGGLRVSQIDQDTGQPSDGSGGPHFHPECDRYVALEDVPKTRCLLSKSADSEGDGPVIFEFVSYLNWSENGDWLTAYIPLNLIDLQPGFGLDDAYAATAIAVAYDAVLTSPRTTPYYPDTMESWAWAACWNETEPDQNSISALQPSKPAPGIGAAPLAIFVLVAAVVRFSTKRRRGND